MKNSIKSKTHLMKKCIIMRTQLENSCFYYICLILFGTTGRSVVLVIAEAYVFLTELLMFVHTITLQISSHFTYLMCGIKIIHVCLNRWPL